MTKEQQRMRTSGVIIALVGLAFAAASWAALYPPTQVFFQIAHWPFHDAPAALDPTARLMVAISGGLTLGLGVMMWTVATEVLPVAPCAGRHVVLYSGIGWFIIDTTFSIVAGSPFNAALNVVFLALMIAPIDFKARASLPA